MMEAVAHAEQAVRNNTNPESAYSHLAVMHYWSMRFCDQDSRGATTRACKRKRFEKAKAALRKSIGHDRFYYDTHRMMAFMMVKQGDLDKAVREIKLSKKIIRNRLHKFRNVKQVDKMVKRALLRDGYKLAREGKHQEAILAYETALERYGEPMPEAHHLMGVSYLKLDRHSMAEKQLSKAIKQDRRLHAARIDLAKLRFAQGRESRAFDILGSLLRPKVKEPDALLVRAWAYEKRGKNELAVRDLRRYLRADPNSRKARRVRKKLKELLRR
jgi:Tfp pilus assembly protein PilF